MAISTVVIIAIMAVVVVGAVVLYVAIPPTTSTTTVPAGPTTTVLGGLNGTTTLKPGGLLNATPSSMPAWVSGQFGSASLFTNIYGGTPPYTCTLGSGSALPTGLTLNDNCTVSGTHILSSGTSQEISPPFIIVLNDSASPEASRSYAVRITTVESNLYEWVGSISGTRHFPVNWTYALCPGGGSIDVLYNLTVWAPAGLTVQDQNGRMDFSTSTNDTLLNGTISGSETVVKQCGTRQIIGGGPGYETLNGGVYEGPMNTTFDFFDANFSRSLGNPNPSLDIGLFNFSWPNYESTGFYDNETKEWSYINGSGSFSTILNVTVTSISDTRMSGYVFFSLSATNDTGNFTFTLARQN